MCTIAGALGAMGAVAQFAGQSQATSAYNAQAAAAHRDAQIAATNKYKDLGSRYVWNIKDLNQKGYDAALKGRQEMAKGVASAGSMGIAAGSNTLDNLINQTRQITANNEANVDSKRDEQHDILINNEASVQAEAQQRINSMPFKKGPNPLSLFLGIANSAMGGGQGSVPQMTGFFGSGAASQLPGIQVQDPMTYVG